MEEKENKKIKISVNSSTSQESNHSNEDEKEMENSNLSNGEEENKQTTFSEDPEKKEKMESKENEKGDKKDKTLNSEEQKKLVMEIPIEEYEELKKKAEEAEKNLYYAQKALADLENYKLKVQKDIDRDRKLTMRNVFSSFLPIIDNLERAIQAAETTKSIEDLVQGLRMIEDEIMKFFSQQGVEPISAVGKPFDPEHHEAMGHIETHEVEPGHVVQEYLKGYKWRDFILRHPKVLIAKKPENKQDEDKEKEEKKED
ncbi:MAG: nucleotide exchange factor GrpE [Planctomycetota bacterium]|nr:MAG: nucleotide exchange factor GrpE [Planctomycetota bacterium]